MTSPFGTVTAPYLPPTRPAGIAEYANWHALNKYERYLLDNAIPLCANFQVPGTQKRRRNSGIPSPEPPSYLRRSQRMIRFHAWESTALKTALDTPCR